MTLQSHDAPVTANQGAYFVTKKFLIEIFLQYKAFGMHFLSQPLP